MHSSIIHNAETLNQLHTVALNVFNTAIQYQVCLDPEWVPREINERADLLSRIVDYDDWCLKTAVFDLVDSSRGSHTCTLDRFVEDNN